jgi:lysozyme
MFANLRLIMAILTKLFQLFSVLKTLFASKSVENTTETVKEVVETVQQAIQPPEPKVVDVESPVEVKEETKIEETIMYTPSGKCYDLIKTFEGFKAKPYKCPAGVPTIGYGSTFYEDGTKVKLTDAPITEARAMDLLGNVVNDFSKQVNKLIKVEVTQHQYDALVDFAYNVGVGNLSSSTLLKKLNAKLYAETAEQFLRWNKAGGVVLAGLTKRRNAEKELFLS